MSVLFGMIYGMVSTHLILSMRWRWYWKLAVWLLGLVVFAVVTMLIIGKPLITAVPVAP